MVLVFIYLGLGRFVNLVISFELPHWMVIEIIAMLFIIQQLLLVL